MPQCKYACIFVKDKLMYRYVFTNKVKHFSITAGTEAANKHSLDDQYQMDVAIHLLASCIPAKVKIMWAVTPCIGAVRLKK